MNILFVVAHPDDEAYGPYGTMVNLSREGHNVSIFCLCNGARPGYEDVAPLRLKAFEENCYNAGVKTLISNNADLSLTAQQTVKEIEDVVKQFAPSIIYTHNISDINNDHRIVAEACLIASRPKPDNCVNELYFFEVPSSTDWAFSHVHPLFKPNVYKLIPDDVMQLKEIALGRYNTETYEFPDARSVEAMKTLAKYRGYQVGLNNAEAFSLVFSRG